MYSQLQQAGTRLNMGFEVVKSAAGSLPGTQYENIRQALQKTAGELDNETLILEKLILVTDTACRYYSTCEDRISANCDSAAVRFTFWQVGHTELGGIKDIVTQIIEP